MSEITENSNGLLSMYTTSQRSIWIDFGIVQCPNRGRGGAEEVRNEAWEPGGVSLRAMLEATQNKLKDTPLLKRGPPPDSHPRAGNLL